MLTQLKLTKVLIILSVFNLFGNIHTEANTLSRQAAVTQQKSKVTGIVEDENGTVVGASIFIKDSSTGTITDSEGRFTLTDLKKGSTLVFSFVGLKTQEIIWKGESILNVKMVSDTQDLDEVIVVAYGTAKKISIHRFSHSYQCRKTDTTLNHQCRTIITRTGCRITNDNWFRTAWRRFSIPYHTRHRFYQC